MDQQPHILISGRDANLLLVRSLVLQSAGYRVSATTRPITQRPVLDGIRLLILCHTLNAEERESDLATAAAACPEATVLLLVP